MTFACNKCSTLIEDENCDGAYLTSCYHVLCKECTQQILNKICSVCSKQCKILKISKDMPAAVKTYFEPPLGTIAKLQQQFRFLRNQQLIAFQLKSEVDKAEQLAAHRYRRIMEYEQSANVERKRLEASIKTKIEHYKRVKEQYQKVAAAEQSILRQSKEAGCLNTTDTSADSGMFSSDKSGHFEQHLGDTINRM